MKANMNILEVRIEGKEKVTERMKAAFKGIPQGHFYTFQNYGQMLKTFSTKRQEIVEAMCGKGEMTVRGVARLVGRDVKAVHADVKALLLVGILDKGENGGVIFPYEGIHFDFSIGRPTKKAA